MKSIVQILCFFAANMASMPAHAGAKTNCNPNEGVFFSCQIGAKIVSLCMQPKGELDEYLEYRFGTPRRIELRYRGTLKDAPRKFFRAEITGVSNTGTTVWFVNQETHYVLNAPVRGGPYLEVIIRGKRISRLPCKDEWAGVEGDLDAESSAIESKSQATFFSTVLGIKTRSNQQQ